MFWMHIQVILTACNAKSSATSCNNSITLINREQPAQRIFYLFYALNVTFEQQFDDNLMFKTATFSKLMFKNYWNHFEIWFCHTPIVLFPQIQKCFVIVFNLHFIQFTINFDYLFHWQVSVTEQNFILPELVKNSRFSTHNSPFFSSETHQITTI